MLSIRIRKLIGCIMIIFALFFKTGATEHLSKTNIIRIYFESNVCRASVIKKWDREIMKTEERLLNREIQ